MQKKAILAISFIVLFGHGIFANNILTSNVRLTGQNTTNNTTQVQFDISWENSWRTTSGPANWDAAWVFVKYRVNGQGPWLHASINNSGNTAPGASVDLGLLAPSAAFNSTTNPGVGAFIHRSVNGSGTFNVVAAQLQWNYGANGVQDNDLVDVQVYAIEEVYVPAGSFFLGSGALSAACCEYGSFYKYPTDGTPYQVTSEAAIPVGATTNNLYYNPALGDVAGPVPAAFPKGYGAFYCMKYELSQQGYADFLNSLSYPLSHSHYDYNGSIGRNRFAIDTIIGSSAFISRAPFIACNFLSWNDLTAYLAWSGLRPMTELEYEKACRGTLNPVPNENAWGTASVANHYYTVTNRDAFNEYISAALQSDPIGNVSCFATVAVSSSPTPGPLRQGIFAASATALSVATRASTGATYYGIMEMSGNVYERAITISNTQGRGFTGTHGNGSIDPTSGYATNADWPAAATAVGSGIRGGSFYTPNSLDSLSVSNRRYTTYSLSTRAPFFGGRGVRTAP